VESGKSEEGRLSRERAVVGFESGIILFGEFGSGGGVCTV